MQHVGIDFSGGIELAQHTEALADPGAGAGAGAARTDSPDDAEAGLPSFTDTAFFLYYDEVAEKYDMRDPLVVAPDGSEVECPKPSSLERGVRYFCVVTLKDGGYAAEVLPESEAEGKDPGGYDALWKVHLFNVPKEGEEDYGDEEPGHEDGMQYHTGAVVVGGGGGGGSGYTGTRVVLGGVKYDLTDHKFLVLQYTETWENGVLVECDPDPDEVSDADWSDMDGGQAVQHTKDS